MSSNSRSGLSPKTHPSTIPTKPNPRAFSLTLPNCALSPLIIMERDLTPQKSKKKRNRESEKLAPFNDEYVDKSTKKPQSLDVKLQVVCAQVDKTPPVIGYFPSGYRPCSGEAAGGPSVRFYRNAQRGISGNNEKARGSERMELVVRPNSGTNVEFVGHSYKGEAMAAQLCTYALGVLDKETKSLKILPIAGNKIFRLDPKVQRPDIAEKEPATVENGKTDNRGRTTNSFSTKKAKNQEMKARALKQGKNPLSEKLLEQQLERAPVNMEALESASAQVARNIPPHNSSADSPQEAYPLDGIIHTVDWDYIGDIYRTLQKGAEIAQDAYPLFVWNRIHRLHTTQDDVQKQTLAGVLSYISHLIKFKDRFSADGRSASKNHENHRIPDILYQRFSGMFNPDSKWLPDVKRDLLISYVLVLTLYADDFQTDPADIAKDLRMNPLDLKSHFLNLGCKVAKDRMKQAFSATLPVPLKFPVLRMKRRRR